MSIQTDNYGNASKFYGSIATGGTKVVTTAATAVQLTATSVKSCEVIIRAKTANTNNIYVGSSDVDNTAGIVLDATESIVLSVKDINEIYIDSDTNGEGVNFSYIY